MTGLTTAQKIAAVNAWTVLGPTVPCIVSPSAILNACVPADIAALPTATVSLLTLLLAGSNVDASAGTTVRLGLQTIFAGKPSLTSLGALAAKFDSPQVSWWQANGYSSPISISDTIVAGVS